jgi:hypothetical protein
MSRMDNRIVDGGFERHDEQPMRSVECDYIDAVQPSIFSASSPLESSIATPIDAISSNQKSDSMEPDYMRNRSIQSQSLGYAL